MRWKHGGLAAVLVCASAVLCYAHSYTWTGASSDDWNQSSNWTTGHVPRQRMLAADNRG